MDTESSSTPRIRSQSLAAAGGHDLVRVGDISPAVVAVRAPASATAERLRGVTMRLLGARDKGRAQCVAIVSPDRSDGRSFVAANLAAIFAQAGRRTLLIDADLRSPCQHTLFQRQAGPGLVTLLRQKTQGYVGQLIEDVPGLHLIAAGEVHTAGEAVSLAGEQFALLLDDLRRSVDQIVIDTPAGSQYPEAEAVAAQAGAAVLLVRRNVTRLAAARRLADDIRTAGAEIVGTVVAHR